MCQVLLATYFGKIRRKARVQATPLEYQRHHGHFELIAISSSELNAVGFILRR